jgi:hypothetical protein
MRRPSTAPPLGRLDAQQFHAGSAFGSFDDYGLPAQDGISVSGSSPSDTPFYWNVPETPSAADGAQPDFDVVDLDRLRMLSASMSKSLPLQSPKKKKEVRISRPPNAWILYRSEKLVEMKEISSRTRTPQAILSKMIAERWRLETPESKKRYEVMAGLKKQEHEMLYPSRYRRPCSAELLNNIRQTTNISQDERVARNHLRLHPRLLLAGRKRRGGRLRKTERIRSTSTT